MGNLKHFESINSAVGRKTGGNPEGKGLNGFLLDWNQSAPKGVMAKTQRQVLARSIISRMAFS